MQENKFLVTGIITQNNRENFSSVCQGKKSFSERAPGFGFGFLGFVYLGDTFIGGVQVTQITESVAQSASDALRSLLEKLGGNEVSLTDVPQNDGTEQSA